jgi:hypothetical protein
MYAAISISAAFTNAPGSTFAKHFADMSHRTAPRPGMQSEVFFSSLVDTRRSQITFFNLLLFNPSCLGKDFLLNT